MADNTLIAEIRSERGTRPAGRLRRDGMVPAVVYGLGTDTQSISVPARELQHMLSGASGANTLITLRLGGKEELALARQIQRHPVKGTLVHVDFIRVRADVAVAADIPVHLEGEAEGAKRGGVLEQSIFSLSVEAKPADIPPSISFDVSELQIGDQVHVRDLTVPAGVTVTNDPEELVVQVVAPRGAEEGVPAEGEAAEGEGAPAAEAAGEPAGEAGASEE